MLDVKQPVNALTLSAGKRITSDSRNSYSVSCSSFAQDSFFRAWISDWMMQISNKQNPAAGDFIRRQTSVKVGLCPSFMLVMG